MRLVATVGLYGSGPLNYQVAMYISLIAGELESKLSPPPPPFIEEKWIHFSMKFEGRKKSNISRYMSSLLDGCANWDRYESTQKATTKVKFKQLIAE